MAGRGSHSSRFDRCTARAGHPATGRGEIEAVSIPRSRSSRHSLMPLTDISSKAGGSARHKYSEAQHDAEQPCNGLRKVRLRTSKWAIQLTQKHFPEAEKFYQQALDKDPSSTDGLSGLMNIYLAQKHYDKAIAAANTQIAKSPKVRNFYDLLGTALFNGKKDYPAPKLPLQKAIALDKNNVDAIEKLGQVEVQQRHPDKALALYQQSIKDNPREVTFYILCGELYEATAELGSCQSHVPAGARHFARSSSRFQQSCLRDSASRVEMSMLPWGWRRPRAEECPTRPIPPTLSAGRTIRRESTNPRSTSFRRLCASAKSGVIPTMRTFTTTLASPIRKTTRPPWLASNWKKR